VIVPGEGAYADVLDRLRLEGELGGHVFVCGVVDWRSWNLELPPKWFLFTSTMPRTGKRRETVQTLYMLFCESDGAGYCTKLNQPSHLCVSSRLYLPDTKVLVDQGGSSLLTSAGVRVRGA
jgi:hypothetical protein